MSNFSYGKNYIIADYVGIVEIKEVIQTDSSYSALFGSKITLKGDTLVDMFTYSKEINLAINSSCGFNINVGEKWLIFAEIDNHGHYKVNYCSLSQKLTSEIDDGLKLQMSRNPQDFIEEEIFTFDELDSESKLNEIDLRKINSSYTSEDVPGGVVFITLTVGYDGTILKISILKGGSNELNDRALEIVRSFGVCVPGEVNSTKVTSEFVIPIKFG